MGCLKRYQDRVSGGLVHQQLEVVGLSAVGELEVVQLHHFPQVLGGLDGEATMVRICHSGFFTVHAVQVACNVVIIRMVAPRSRSIRVKACREG